MRPRPLKLSDHSLDIAEACVFEYMRSLEFIACICSSVQVLGGTVMKQQSQATGSVYVCMYVCVLTAAAGAAVGVSVQAGIRAFYGPTCPNRLRPRCDWTACSIKRERLRQTASCPRQGSPSWSPRESLRESRAWWRGLWTRQRLQPPLQRRMSCP